jgi:hypothetical protein
MSPPTLPRRRQNSNSPYKRNKPDDPAQHRVGRTQVTTTRLVVAVAAEVLIVAYLLFALGLFGR